MLAFVIAIFVTPPSPLTDRDGDGVPDSTDNCVDTANPGQDNSDGDCLGDACDSDSDGDGLVNDRDPCPHTFSTIVGDEDGDGVDDACDVCPTTWDPAQLDEGELDHDEQSDGVGDACDPNVDQGGDRRDDDPSAQMSLARQSRYFTTFRVYRARRGDSWQSVARRFHMDIALLQRTNPGRDRLPPLVRIPIAHLLPLSLAEGVTINIPERTLYFVDGGRLEAVMPVAVGRGPTTVPDEDWSTRVGTFVVTAKREHPTWYVPPSIRREMARLGEEVRAAVPPGPENPLGALAIYTNGGFLLHEAANIDSIMEFASHGCIRMMPEDVRELYHRVGRGTRVTVIYEDVKLAQTPEGRVLLEAHPDHYRAFADSMSHVTSVLAPLTDDRVDRMAIQHVLEERDGRVHDVSRMCADRIGATLARCD